MMLWIAFMYVILYVERRSKCESQGRRSLKREGRRGETGETRLLVYILHGTYGKYT